MPDQSLTATPDHLGTLNRFLADASIDIPNFVSMLEDQRYRLTLLKGLKPIATSFKKRTGAASADSGLPKDAESRQKQPAATPARNLPTDQRNDFILPGTTVSIHTLTPPKSWVYLLDGTQDGQKMAFVGKITKYTKNDIELDFGNGQYAVLRVPESARLYDNVFDYNEFPVGTLIHVKDVVRLKIASRYFLQYTEQSKIAKIDTTFATLVEVNDQLNKRPRRVIGAEQRRRTREEDETVDRPQHPKRKKRKQKGKSDGVEQRGRRIGDANLDDRFERSRHDYGDMYAAYARDEEFRRRVAEFWRGLHLDRS